MTIEMRRMTVAEQMSRNVALRGKPLAVEVHGPRGFSTRAEDVLRNLPALLAVNGVEVKFFTPLGLELNAAALIGKTAEEIDAAATQIDMLSQAAVARPVSLAAQIGVSIKRLPAGEFTYQGQRGVKFNGCGIAETPFTNGQFRQLLALKGEELSKIVANPEARLAKSVGVAAVASEAESCPMVHISQIEANGIAKMLGKRLATEVEYERAASSTDGRAYPFGNDFDEDKVTFNDKGTRSVYLHRDGASPEGILDLAGNVWQWTSSNYDSSGRTIVLRGGCWYYGYADNLRAVYRCFYFPGGSNNLVGFRLAED